MRAGFLSAIALGALFLLLASPASAARPCRGVPIDKGVKAKVATVRVECRLGREVATIYFERVRSGDDWDGKTGDGSIFYSVKGFRCLTGLAGTQMFCHRQNRRVFASTRPGDDPASWRASVG